MASPPDRMNTKNGNLVFRKAEKPKNAAELAALPALPPYKEGYYYIYDTRITPPWRERQFVVGPALLSAIKRPDVLGLKPDMTINDRVKVLPPQQAGQFAVWYDSDKTWKRVPEPLWYRRVRVGTLFFPPGFEYVGQITVEPPEESKGPHTWNPATSTWDQKASTPDVFAPGSASRRLAIYKKITARGDLVLPAGVDYKKEDISEPPASRDKMIFTWDENENTWNASERYPGRKDLFFSPAAKITETPPAPKKGKIFTWNFDWEESDNPHMATPAPPLKPHAVKLLRMKAPSLKPPEVKPPEVKPPEVKPPEVKPPAVKPPMGPRNRLKDKGPEFDRVDLHLPEPWPAQVDFASHTFTAPPDYEEGKEWVYDPYVSRWKPDYKSLSRENLVKKFSELHESTKAEEEAAAGPQGDPTSSRPSGREKITLSGRVFYIDYDNASRDRRKAVFTDPDTTETLVEPEESLLETVGITGDTRKAVQIYLNDFFDALPNCQTTTQMLTNRRCEVSYYVMWSVLLKARQEVVREMEDKRREGMPDQDVHQMQARLDAMGSVSKVRLDGSSSSASGPCCDRDHEEHEDIKAIVENIKDNLEKARVDITNIKEAKRGGGLSEIERLFRRQTE
jgi:hypothetical protein